MRLRQKIEDKFGGKLDEKFGFKRNYIRSNRKIKSIRKIKMEVNNE